MPEKTCNGCNGKCCRYVVIEIDTPETADDFEYIKWYVAHENVQVFVEEDGTWNIEFITNCRHLNKENKCEIYEKRPKICRDFSHEDCPHHNEYNEIFSFRKIEDIENYIEKIFNKGLHVIKKEDKDETQGKNPPKFVAGKD